MNIFQFSWQKLTGRPLNFSLAVVLFAIGVAVISLLISFEKSINSNYKNNLADINLVVGAKGSPLQLILSSVLHADAPTGNIDMDEAMKLNSHPLVKNTIPLALGDNYKGFRIVGTSFDYAELYDAELNDGEWFFKPLEVTLGFDVAKETGLKVGDTFSGVHGFLESGHAHDDIKYTIVGVMSKSNSVLDRLILTPIKSVWLVHGHDCDLHDHAHDEGNMGASEVPSIVELKLKAQLGEELTPAEFEMLQNGKSLSKGSNHQITALLVFYKNALGAVQLPRLINETTSMQAASPALELSRLLKLLGYGLQAFTILAWLIIVISGVNCFIHIWNTLQANLNEIALLRAVGTGVVKIVVVLIMQALTIASLGWLLGIILSKTIAFILTASSIFYMGSILILQNSEMFLLFYCWGIAIVATIIPARFVYKNDIHFVLRNI